VKLDLSGHPMRTGSPPEWADEWGEDAHGPFASFVVEGVVQRMRWVPPGTSLMGSPDDEKGRFGREGPRHEVTLTRGYWLGDTPVTQALWVAVMGDNPSHHEGDERPVERVSWDDVQSFLGALEAPGLGLPTEAEWERACRAGHDGPNWLEVGVSLEEIARFGGGDGTAVVASKAANPLGLYDMLGNVYEWCADAYAPYHNAPVRDPYVDAGSSRVYRGGSWYSGARRCRAAYRRWRSPGDRSWSLGFRLGRGQGHGAEPRVGGPPAERVG